MRRYFAYGANMDAAAMAERCPSARLIGPAVLDGWRIALEAAGHATIVAATAARPPAKVFGVLWSILPADERALDAFEGVADGMYAKSKLRVRRLPGGPTMPALAYVAAEAPGASPRLPYLDAVIAAARARGLPATHLASLDRLRR